MTTVMMERTGMGVPSVGMPGMATQTVGSPTGTTGTNYVMVPRGTIKMEKCTGGMKVNVTCDDKTAVGMVQSLCQMLAGGMVSCCTVLNGMTVGVCNFTMGLCTCETTASGVCITVTSGDQKCCEMIQACCDCVCVQCAAGCTCCVMINGTPICCSTPTQSATPSKK